MRGQIIKVLRQSVGMRQRDIAWRCQCWTADPDFIKVLRELEADGTVVSEQHRDIGNMEDYYIYSLKEDK